MAKISGVLTDGAGQIINDCTIELSAKKTTSKVLNQTQAFKVTENGKYEINALPCNYEVSLIINGFPKKKLGVIQVFSDSVDGTLNDFLINPTESEITPEILQQVIESRNKAQQSADTAKVNAETSTKNAKSASDSATQASASATSASTSASNTSKSATAAKTSETNAKNSATQAAASATSAENSKIASALSEANAKISETNAATSAKNGKTSETNAKTSENNAAKSALEAKNAASSLDTSSFVKKSGDTMTGPLTVKTDNYGLTFENSSGYKWLSRIHADNSYSISQYDSTTNSWAFKLRYTSSANAWRFENIADVTINNVSVLKQGDGGLFSKAPILAANTDLLTDDVLSVSQTFTLAGAYVNSPVDGSVLTGTLKVTRRYYDAGAAATLEISHAGNVFYKATAYKANGIWKTYGWVEVVTSNNIKNYAGVAYITETYTSDDGLSWYRKWSDGWIEQGGVKTGSFNSTSTHNLITPFSNANYTILLNALYNNNAGSVTAAAMNKTNSTFQSESFRSNVGNVAYTTLTWYACGY